VTRWIARAACGEADDNGRKLHDPLLWFPPKNQGDSNQGLPGKRICARCPVLTDCLRYAISVRQQDGIWGGAGYPTRRRIARLLPAGERGHEPDGCEFCRAVAEHERMMHAAWQDGELQHGRWETYVSAGCRCAPCSRANKRHGLAEAGQTTMDL
jgi:WhiB family redox-sensing transcriptional regulator